MGRERGLTKDLVMIGRLNTLGRTKGQPAGFRYGLVGLSTGPSPQLSYQHQRRMSERAETL